MHRDQRYQVKKRASTCALVMSAILFGALPQGAGAQTAGEPPPAGESAQAASNPASASDKHSLERMDLRVRRARIGLISTAAATVVGLPLFWVGVAHPDCFFLSAFGEEPAWCNAVAGTGFTLMFGGAVGMIVTGSLLGVRKRERRRLQATHEQRARKVQWDLERGRVVF